MKARTGTGHELRERPWALPTADACCWLLLLLSPLLSVQPSESSELWGEAGREYEQH